LFPFFLIGIAAQSLESQIISWDGTILGIYDECPWTHGVNSHEDEHRGGLMVLTTKGELIVDAYNDVGNYCRLRSEFLSGHAWRVIFGNGVAWKQGVTNTAAWTSWTLARFTAPLLDRKKIHRLLFSDEEYWNCQNPSSWCMARIFQGEFERDGRAVGLKNKWTSDLYVSRYPRSLSNSHFVQLASHHTPLKVSDYNGTYRGNSDRAGEGDHPSFATFEAFFKFLLFSLYGLCAYVFLCLGGLADFEALEHPRLVWMFAVVRDRWRGPVP
jgi:hypothetical protein